MRLRGYRAHAVLVWNERRSVRVKADGFTDAFAPLAVHVYDVS